jgi:pyruvate dehydrogenase E1 component
MTDLSTITPSIFALAQVRADNDPQETAEWLEALDGVVRHAGLERAQYLFGSQRTPHQAASQQRV